MAISEARTSRVTDYMALSTEYMAFLACDHIRGGQTECAIDISEAGTFSKKGHKFISYLLCDIIGLF